MIPARLAAIPPWARGVPLRQWQLLHGHAKITQQEIDAWVRRCQQDEVVAAKKYQRKVRT